MIEKHILYDFDGVLADSLSAHMRFMKDIGEEYNLNISLPHPEDLEANRKIVANPMKAFLQRAGFPESLVDEVDEIYKQTFSKNPKYKFKLFPGVSKLISELEELKYPQSILSSNCIENILPVLEREGIQKSINLIVDREQLELTKNGSKTKVLALLKEYEIWDKIIFIGDTEKDYQAAKDAGVMFVGSGYGWQITSDDTRFPVANNISHLRDILVGI